MQNKILCTCTKLLHYHNTVYIDLSLLMRLKKRRRTYSMGQPVTNHGAKTTGTPSSLSAFVQSALKHTPSGGREGGEASRAASGARSVSSRRKKQRIGMMKGLDPEWCI